MTNNIATTGTTATTVRDTADALMHGARHGRPATPGPEDLVFSFQDILHKGVGIDVKDVKASMSMAHFSAQDPTSPPDTDPSSWRPSFEDDVSTSDVDSTDDYRDWEASDGTRDQETREPGDPAADTNRSVGDVHSPVHSDDGLSGADDAEFADGPLTDAGNDPAASVPGAIPSADAAGSPQNAKDAADPVGSQTRSQETTPSPANPTQRGGTISAARPATDGADVPLKASAAAGQANELAKSLPAGNDLKINVAVSKPGDTLFSQPAASLAAASVADGQKSGSRPGQVPVGASAKAGFTAALNPGQAPVAAQPNIQARGGSSASDPQLQTGAQGNQANLAAPQSKGAGTSPSTSASSFTDVTGIGSSARPETAQRTGSGPISTVGKPVSAQPPVAEQISVQISKAVKAGIDRIDIQLRPKELGRVDIRLELAGDGRVNATVTVDNRETLELLKTDARGLEKALDDAGLKADSNSLNFNLRGQGDRSSGNPPSQASHPGGLRGEGEAELDGDITARTLGDYSRGGLSADGRIDIEI